MPVTIGFMVAHVHGFQLCMLIVCHHLGLWSPVGVRDCDGMTTYNACLLNRLIGKTHSKDNLLIISLDIEQYATHNSRNGCFIQACSIMHVNLLLVCMYWNMASYNARLLNCRMARHMVEIEILPLNKEKEATRNTRNGGFYSCGTHFDRHASSIHHRMHYEFDRISHNTHTIYKNDGQIPSPTHWAKQGHCYSVCHMKRSWSGAMVREFVDGQRISIE